MYLMSQIAIMLIVLTTAASIASAETGDTMYQQWGRETLEMIDRHFAIPGTDHYAEKIGPEVQQRHISFNWGAGVQLSAFTAAARVDPAYRERLKRYLKAMEEYWYVDGNGLGGYNASPRNKGDRYYDDNAWVVLALVEAYEVLGEPALLDRAQEALKFVLSGEDDKLGGGIYWNEPHRNTKNTCSNAPTAAAAIRIWQHTKNPEHLETGRRLYEWTRKQFQDTDGLFFDHITLDGKLDQTKWTYNSALMIRSATLLYEATGEQAYLDEAKRIAAASEKKWVDPQTGAIADGGRFAHLLCDALMDLSDASGDGHWAEVARRAINWAHDNTVDPDGLYGERWEKAVTEPLKQAELIAQSSAARAYWRAAWPAKEAAR